MIIDTLSGLGKVVCSINANSFTEPIPTLTQPSGSGIIAFGTPQADLISGGTGGPHGTPEAGMFSPGALCIFPFGTGTTGAQFNTIVYGWRLVKAGNVWLQDMWFPVPHAILTCTLNANILGLTATNFPSGQCFCSTISLAFGNSGISSEVASPAGTILQQGIAHAVVDMKGCRLAELRFAPVNPSPATSFNALVTKM